MEFCDGTQDVNSQDRLKRSVRGTFRATKLYKLPPQVLMLIVGSRIAVLSRDAAVPGKTNMWLRDEL